MTLGEKLVHLRKELGLSQLEAAEKLNVSRQAISRWEVGAAVPSVDNLKYLSELYGVPVDVLLDGGQDLLAWREGQQRREQEPPEAPPEPEHTAEPRPRGRRWPQRRWRLGLRLVCLWGWASRRIGCGQTRQSPIREKRPPTIPLK